MSNSKVVMSQAANTLVTPLNVEDVFSTYLYTGNEGVQAITNDIDLDGEGGLVWIKLRNLGERHALFDNERGLDSALATNEDSQARIRSGWMQSFNSNGFTLNTGDTELNNLGDDYASWTFRKAPKFFDVVTWTGDGTTGRAISHNLGCEVGAIFVKTTSGSSNWYVYNRNLTSANYGLKLNGTDAEAFWGTGNVTDTTFSFDHQNGSGNTYVAYLFAHNDGDGEFGPDGDADIIKCGSFDGASNTEVDLGFEPQWILFKSSNGPYNWGIVDNMRGIPSGGNDSQLLPNGSEAETANENVFDLNPTGFTWKPNASGNTYIYIAIRRGTKVPESATEVFAIDASPNSSFPVYEAGFPVDLGIKRYDYPSSGNSNFACDRLRGSGRLFTNLTNAESSSTDVAFDSQVGWWTQPENSTSISWMWKRAPGFFDAVAYTGDGVAGRTVSHNLGVAPEMMWVKNRESALNWTVYVGSLGNDYRLFLNKTNAVNANPNSSLWNSTSPTDTVFTLGTNDTTNYNGTDFIAYLFASLDGISKVGSFTATGSVLDIDCGFTSGARFVLIKRTDSTGEWFVFDAERGITASTSPWLALDSTSSESVANYIDPLSSGFRVTTNFYGSGDFIFYAIA